MAKLPATVNRLISSFERLPGIGPKTAARLTFYLLNVPQDYLTEFGNTILTLKQRTIRCSICANIDEQSPCIVCADSQRDTKIVCVVEQPLDIVAFEKTAKYQGLYHVLHGVIAPLDNIGPEELTIGALFSRLRTGNIDELILATNTNVEGEATAMYIAKQLEYLAPSLPNKVKITRLAHGLPVGGDIEYADEMTLSRALEGRNEY